MTNGAPSTPQLRPLNSAPSFTFKPPPLTSIGEWQSAQAIVSTEREFYNPIPECKLLVDVASRVSNTRTYSQGLAKKHIDPKTVWATPKAKRNKFFEKYEKDFLEKAQPIRTDLEFVTDGREFVDVLIPPPK